MRTLREWLRRFRASLRRQALDRQAEDEMRFHLEMEVEAAIRRGLSVQQAKREARLRAGSVAAALDEVRDQRGIGWFDAARMELRHAWMALSRRPGFLVTAGGALTFAVAVNTLIFAIVYGVLLKPLPYPHPERLVRIFEATPRNPKWPISIYNFLEDCRANRTLDGIALYTGQDMQLMHGDRAERVTGVQASNDFFPTLGAAPVLGRNFSPEEMHRGVRTVILSYTFWKTRFGGDPRILGKMLRLNRENWQVIGVLPEGFQHVGGTYRSPLQGDTVAIWTPLALDIPVEGQRNWHYTNAIARLKPGISPAAAREDLNRIMDDLARRFPDNYGRARARLEPLAAEVTGGSRLTVRIVIWAGILVLLIACVNIAGLCVARGMARRRELAVRQVLGAGAWRIARAVLAENVVLGVIGGCAGLALSAALMPVLHAVLPVGFPRLDEIRFTWAAALFAVLTAVLTSAAAALIPAFRQVNVDPSEGLNEEARTASGGRRIARLRGVLVASEIAIACVLSFGALLLARSSAVLDARDHGFDMDRVLTFQIALPPAAYAKTEQFAAFYREAARRWSEIPGVRAAGISTNLPWTGYDDNTSFDIVGRPAQPGESMQARYQAANAGYFRALRMRLIAGRFVEPGDEAESPKVVVINQALERRYFGKTDPLGQYLDLWGAKRRIVGVVADVRDKAADPDAEPGFWWPLSQQPFGLVQAALRTEGPPLAAVPAVRAALQSLDRELPMAELRTMEDIGALALAERRFALLLCESFAFLALALAGLGVYGMLAYNVEQRRREIGIRMALGATRADVLRTVLSKGLILAACGIMAGLAAAPLVGRALAGMLYGVTATDFTTLAITPMLMMAMALAGSFVPAWHAATAEPMSPLREQ
jgi:macrolide transport system ATP-binding/permease protein